MGQEAYEAIQEKRLKPWKGEEEVRYIWMKVIEDATGLHLNAERGRKDSSHNHVIIEFKAPGLFRGKKDSPGFKSATEERLLPYIQCESAKTGIPESDFIGIAIDGEHICFAQVHGDQIHTQHLIPFSTYAVDLVIDAFVSDTRKALTTENLLADFGHGSADAREFMQAMSDGLLYYLKQQGNNKIKMLFEEWRTLYGQVADMSISQTEAINKEIAFIWNGFREDSTSARLFVIHTYNSILIKLLAAEIVSAHGLTSSTQPAQSMSAQKDDDELVNYLDYSVEKSAIFREAGINGFVEEAIFSWYIGLARDKVVPALLPSLRRLLSVLSLYRLDHLSRTRDVLRDLYQGLVPGKLRQSLGEFYTPDWLVDFTLQRAANNTLLEKRVLDPTCGSGAFLLAVIRKKRELAAIQGWSVSKVIKNLCDSVWGFDLNPLAVQTARVNFLMEIADLLAACPGMDIEVPVLMADAIYSPAEIPSGKNRIVEYNIGSQVAKLNIHLPVELALNRERLDFVFERMGKDVEQGLEFDKSSQKLTAASIVTQEELSNWDKPLRHTYDQVLNLHRKQWNGIWFRIVRNFFWSAAAGKFDLVIGNPPWVRWSKLPDLYRERVKPTCEDYGIFSKTKRHGGNELDISAMITYTVSDKWLDIGGKLAFVITGTLFKNPSSAGFRTFKLDSQREDSLYLQPLSVDDMKELKPFEDASNHTSVALFRKSIVTAQYPVAYRVWSANPGHRKAIRPCTPLNNVLKAISHTTKEAFPVGDEGSPWAILAPGRFNAIKYLSLQCEWTKGRKGITTDLNGVYFVPILQNNGTLVQIQSRPEAGRKDIGPQKTQWVEPDMLYPLIKGASDFDECYLKLDAPDYDDVEQRLFTFVPNTGISNAEYESADAQLHSPKMKKTLAWFKGFERLLLERSTYRRQMKGAPYHAVYNVGDYTFKPWKVIWPEMSSSFYAAVASFQNVPVVGERVYIPDHKVYFASFDNKETAYYLCGLLNSLTVQEWINSHNVSIQVADVFKHLSLPNFDITNTMHTNLAELVEEAHQCHDKTERQKIIKRIKSVAENVLIAWSVTLVE
ncbi:Eco57I restriction-modification methylase domain-containing protein [Photorhabdus kayaii]|uniref:Eco57I restriction-modification methylase domain-containing protein n=1 Tax=Photorhabdus kayaii TaxID=230088 RepID=UPI0021D51B5F|nr:N-6 DNA methylase [Photorhabdus kayaii]MCT8352118.1 N-6 DNA methylase [Photorhabdus kayaii]